MHGQTAYKTIPAVYACKAADLLLTNYAFDNDTSSAAKLSILANVIRYRVLYH